MKMICFRKLKDEDIEKIQEFLGNEKIYNLILEGIVYVVIENNEIVGIGKVVEKSSKWFLDFIIIKSNMRRNGLGDGLLRVLSNNLLNKGIDKLYYHEENEYLRKKGFMKKGNLFELKLKDMFQHNCRASGG